MDKKLSVAVIGAGRIAGGYDIDKIAGDPGIYTHAGAYQKDGRFLLKMVCDTDAERAGLFSKQWGVETAATDLKEIYREYHDVVSICTPDSTHFDIISNIIRNKAAKTIFAEKPLALREGDLLEIIRLAEENDINVVVNFQRRFDGAHERLKKIIEEDPGKLLAVNAYYIKGLDHIGITLIDTLNYLFGVPKSVYAYNRIFNKQINDYTYEFILFFDSYNVTVKTIDTELADYNYHIFEIDMLFPDKRVTINDNSRTIETRVVVDYAYSGVKALDDRHPLYEESDYRLSMLNVVDYIHEITTGSKEHTINTPAHSNINMSVIKAVKSSYEKNIKVEVRR